MTSDTPENTAGSARHHRPGAVLAVTLVCLFVVAALGSLLLRALLQERRQGEVRMHQLQALWLAESAAARARAQLARSAEYAGETWTVPAETLGDRWSAAAEIRVTRLDGQPQSRLVVVEACYPNDPDRRVSQRIEFRYHLGGANSR